jgi:hypothetical protein
MFSNAGTWIEAYVVVDDGTFPDDHIVVHHGKWSDLHFVSKGRIRMYAG